MAPAQAAAVALNIISIAVNARLCATRSPSTISRQHCRLEYDAQVSRHGGKSSGFADGDQGRGRRYEERVAIGTHHAVGEYKSARTRGHQRGVYANGIVVTGRGMKAHGDIGNRQLHAFAFEFGVRLSQCANKVGTTELTPYEVVGMIHHAHLVGFGVSHAQVGCGFGHCGRNW